MINDDNDIDFYNTDLAINNFSSFGYTKEFLKKIYKSYKNIIEFYINIMKKTKNLKLNHEIIILSYFYLLKSFYIKFIDFYNTECDISSDDLKRIVFSLIKI
jgi:hypothetical protein